MLVWKTFSFCEVFSKNKTLPSLIKIERPKSTCSRLLIPYPKFIVFSAKYMYLTFASGNINIIFYFPERSWLVINLLGDVIYLKQRDQRFTTLNLILFCIFIQCRNIIYSIFLTMTSQTRHLTVFKTRSNCLFGIL